MGHGESPCRPSCNPKTFGSMDWPAACLFYDNFFDFQYSVMRADPAFAVVAFAAAKLEGNDFLALFIWLDDLGGHTRAFDVGLADLHLVAIGHQQHVLQRDLLALLAIKEFDLHDVAGLDAVLLGTCSNYCIHKCVLFPRGKGSER